MVKKSRPAKRPFNSPVADVAGWALQAFAPDQFLTRQDIHQMVVRDWQQALRSWYKEQPEFTTEGQWKRMRGCPTSLFWTPALASPKGKRARVRACCQRWLCPFCYSREVVNFLRPFEVRQFQVYEDVVDDHDPEAIWSYFKATTARLNREHGAVASWRYVYRVSNTWLGRGAWLCPGPYSFRELDSTLAQALAYPYGMLSRPLADSVLYLGFMRERRGREVAGLYRAENNRNRR